MRQHFTMGTKHHGSTSTESWAYQQTFMCGTLSQSRVGSLPETQDPQVELWPFGNTKPKLNSYHFHRKVWILQGFELRVGTSPRPAAFTWNLVQNPEVCKDCSAISLTDLVLEVPRSPCLLPGIFQSSAVSFGLLLSAFLSVAKYFLLHLCVQSIKLKIQKLITSETSLSGGAQPISCEEQQTVVRFSSADRQICRVWPEDLGAALHKPPGAAAGGTVCSLTPPSCYWCISSCNTTSCTQARGRKKECAPFTFSQRVLRSNCFKWLGKLTGYNWCGDLLPASWQRHF